MVNVRLLAVAALVLVAFCTFSEARAFQDGRRLPWQMRMRYVRNVNADPKVGVVVQRTADTPTRTRKTFENWKAFTGQSRVKALEVWMHESGWGICNIIVYFQDGSQKSANPHWCAANGRFQYISFMDKPKNDLHKVTVYHSQVRSHRFVCGLKIILDNDKEFKIGETHGKRGTNLYVRGGFYGLSGNTVLDKDSVMIGSVAVVHKYLKNSQGGGPKH